MTTFYFHSEKILQLATMLLVAGLPITARPAGGQQGQPDPAVTPLDQEPIAEVVQHAGGTVQLQVPRGWFVHEVAVGRTIRLLLTPGSIESDRAFARDGVWISVHADRSSPSAEQVQRWAAGRLTETVPDAQPQGDLESLQLAGHPAWRASFRRDRASSGSATVGSHWAVQVPWGIVELQTQSPEHLLPERAPVLLELVRSLRLQPPKLPPTTATNDQTRAAAPILGSWKATHSRLRLRPDGQIQIHPDRDARLGRPAEPQDPSAASVTLRGRFESRDDLLLVRWADGSLQNYRWRLAGDLLLLTDHEGHISQLRRIYE